MGTAPQGHFTPPPARERSYATTARQRTILTNNARPVLQGITAPATAEPTLKSRAPPASFPTPPGPLRRRTVRKSPALLGPFAWKEPLLVPDQNGDVSSPVALVILQRAEWEGRAWTWAQRRAPFALLDRSAQTPQRSPLLAPPVSRVRRGSQVPLRVPAALYRVKILLRAMRATTRQTRVAS